MEEMMTRAHHSQQMPLKKGTWSPEEDQKLIAYIKRYGIWNWSEMPKAAGLSRSGKSCRLRWMNYLRPDIKRGNFSKEELESILKLHQMLGNRWSLIAAKLPGRTDNEIKNYWNTHLKKSLKIHRSMQATELRRMQTSIVESKLKNSSENDFSVLSTPKAQTPEDSKGTILVSPKESTANFSPITNNPVCEISKSQTIEENIDLSDRSAEEPTLWRQPFSMESLYTAEDYDGATYTDSLWLQESSLYPYASSHDDVGNDFWVNCV